MVSISNSYSFFLYLSFNIYYYWHLLIHISTSICFSTKISKSLYSHTPKSKGMKSFVRLFEIDSSLVSYSKGNDDEDQLSNDMSRRDSIDSLVSDVTTTLPKINEPTNEKLPKPLFIQTPAESNISNTRGPKKTTFTSQNSQGASPSPSSASSLSTRRIRDRKQSTRAFIQRKLSAGSSSSTTKSIQLKRQSSSMEIYCDNLPSLPTEKISKYFGDKSKIKFYQTYREINHIKDNLVGGAKEIENYVKIQEKDYEREIDEIASSQGWEMSNTDYYHGDGTSTLLSQEENFIDDLSTSENSPDSQTGKNYDLSHYLSPPKSSSGNYNLKVNEDGGSISDYSLISTNTKRSFTPSSPRAKYIAGCIKNNVPPRSSLLLRDNITSCLMLEHQGIGDKMGELLSSGLEDMPFLTAVNIADNNLTDSSLKLLIETISQKPSITELNISRNKVGSETAQALGKYLKSSKCTLKKLSMRASNVDDGECHHFVDALGHNRCLEVFSLLISLFLLLYLLLHHHHPHYLILTLIILTIFTNRN